jgi:tetratricopeptide (TPR) repeat protein
MQDLRQGTELANRYTLVRRLGGGGAAETWLASDRMTRAEVALKILVSDRLSLDALRKEWQTSIRLMHAHIVRVFEFNDDPARPFYSLQYVAGPDIGVLAGAPLADCLPPVTLIADALRYAHGKGVVHRDIKAANVLLDHNGAPYLIDFGVAARSGAAAGGGSLIAASPQSLAGEASRPADDIFALGGLIYELVSGRSPYSATATAGDIAGVVPGKLTAADGSDVPPGLADLVARMLDKDAARRPDAATVAAELEALGFKGAPAAAAYVAEARGAAAEVIEASEARPARSGTPATPSLPAAGRRSGLDPRIVATGFAVLLVILLGVVFLLPSTVQELPETSVVETEDAGEQAPESGQRRRGVGFTENVEDLEGRDERVVARAETETVLGELLSKMDLLDKRAVQRWGGLRYRQAQAVYAQGDEAYLDRNYGLAISRYREAIGIVDPLIDEVDAVFEKTFADAERALAAADPAEALRLFELAVAISPGDAAAQAGYARAKNLDTVLGLVDRGVAFEKDLELDAARQSFARAAEIDPRWQPAQDGLVRVEETIRQMDFDQRMTEGLMALADGDFASARAAFLAAQKLKPGSPEPADGLLQVDQGLRLNRIVALEAEAERQVRSEEWTAAVATFEAVLEIDDSLQFAQEGIANARRMAALHAQLDEYIAAPDRLSAPATMRAATALVVDITRMPEIGPRLADRRDELSRLLKRAATPLTVRLVSDNATSVSVYKVGKLGSFTTRELNLRPGSYVAVGSRPGYRDVRVEFQVGPELENAPVVVRCEEVI